MSHRKTLMVLISLVAMFSFSEISARANDVVIATGNVIYIGTSVRVSLGFSNGASVSYSGDCDEGGPFCPMSTITQGHGTFFGDSLVTRTFGGGLGVSDSILTGGIIAFPNSPNPPNTPPLFTLRFESYGYFTRQSPGQYTFVAVGAPEPGTMLLLATALAGAAVCFRRRLLAGPPARGQDTAGVRSLGPDGTGPDHSSR